VSGLASAEGDLGHPRCEVPGVREHVIGPGRQAGQIVPALVVAADRELIGVLRIALRRNHERPHDRRAQGVDNTAADPRATLHANDDIIARRSCVEVHRHVDDSCRRVAGRHACRRPDSPIQA
jgi:hypothetical protein